MLLPNLAAHSKKHGRKWENEQINASLQTEMFKMPSKIDLGATMGSRAKGALQCASDRLCACWRRCTVRMLDLRTHLHFAESGCNAPVETLGISKSFRFMSNRGRKSSAERMQSPRDNHSHTEGQSFEDRIWESAKVRCKVSAGPDLISIRANSFADFILARNSIKSSAGSRAIIQG